MIAPIGVALGVEVTNSRPTKTRVIAYVLDVRQKWYRWKRLGSISMKDPLSICWAPKDLADCIRLDFSKNAFDIHAEEALEPGESIRGWMFFEWPQELRNEPPMGERFRVTLWNSHREEQTIYLEPFDEPGLDPWGAGTELTFLVHQPHRDLRGFSLSPILERLPRKQK
jgi:hypothetical protein